MVNVRVRKGQKVRVGTDTTYLYDPSIVDEQVEKAKEWATKTDGMVEEEGVGVDYSSKAYAIGGTGTETNNSKHFSGISQTWAEGDDEDVEALGGTHSSLGSAGLSYAYANAPEDTPVEEFAASHDVIVHGEKGDKGDKGDDGAQGEEGPEGPAGKDGVDGVNATINGVSTLTLTASDGLTLSQSGSTANISGTTLSGSISSINALIPAQATALNQLSDKAFVNSSIATNTANFIGTFNSVAEMEAYSGTLTNNDYAFVVGTDSAGNTKYDRYKYTTATTPASWVYEYTLNNSSFTANQWSAINSGATTTNIGQITTNQNAIGTLSSLTTTTKTDLVSAINEVDSVASGKQDALTAGTGIDITSGTISVTTPTIVNTATGEDALTILGTPTTYRRSTNVGVSSEATGEQSTSFGRGARVTKGGGTAVGSQTECSATLCTSLGYGSKATASHAIALGANARNSEAQTFKVALNNSWDAATDEASGLYTLLDSNGKVPTGRYVAMTGADGINAGTIGAVPAPSASDNNKFLRGDGTWANAGGGGGSSAIDSGPNDPASSYTADEGTRYFNTTTGQNFIYGDVENFRRLFYGTPYLTIVNGVATGFNSNGHIQLAQKFNPGNNDWEILMHLKTPSTVGTSGLMGYSSNAYCGLKWEINSSGKMSLSLCSVNNSWNIANEVAGSTTLSADTEYWYKIVHSQSGETYKGFISTDGTNYTEDLSISSSSGLYNYGSALYIGRSNSNYFAGSVYLKDMKITISGDVWWTPYITECRKILLNGSDDPTSVSIDTTANIVETLTSSNISAKDAVNIGNGSRATASRSTIIGAMASSTNSSGTAIGYNARTTGVYSIQIGNGSNATANTLSVGLSSSDNYQLLNSSGKVPVDRYIPMTGATGSVAGTAGAVPAPAATDNTKFLRGDGTWATVGGSSTPQPRTVYDKTASITSGTISLADDTTFYTDSPSASTTYTISASALTQTATSPYVYFNVVITMPSTAVGIDFTTNNTVTWTEGTTPDMSTGGRTYLLAFQSFDGGTSWIGSLATWWNTPTP